MPAASTLDLDALDTVVLKALIRSQDEQLSRHAAEIERLKLLIARLQRMQFGRKSEKLEREIRQLELQLDDLEESAAESRQRAEHILPAPAAAVFASVMRKPARGPLPDHLPRQTETHQPEEDNCPECGGELRKLGEDISEILEYVPARFQVIRHVRPKLSCTKCDVIVQAAAPSRPIARGLAGPGLLAHVLVSKYADHQPLYRQAEIYVREGVELERSTLADRVGGSAELLAPLNNALRQYVMSASKLHVDDTPVPVLAPGTGKTKLGRLWTYVRDDRPSGNPAGPAVWFAYSPDRKGEHPHRHLAAFTGTMQADGYAGFNRLYDSGRIREAACWAHVRRKFFDIHQAHASPVAKEAIERIGQMYAIESEIRGTAPEQRQQVRPVLHRIADHPINRIRELLPWNLFSTGPVSVKAA